MLYILITTPICNLICKYCGGSLHGMPEKITYSLADLKDFISRDNEAVIAFYGGEPLLNADFIIKVITSIPAKHFVINTNGYYIESIKPVLDRFNSILLSIDGREQVTDYYRQQGCYQKVMNALDFLHANNFSGEIIARMSVSIKSDIYKEVTHLLNFFPFIHWQLDMIWSPLWELEEFSSWADEQYLPGIKRLIAYWIDHMHQGRILGIVPFLGIMSRMLHGGNGLPCQSGSESVTITTDGTILACPIAPDYSWNKLGNLQNGFKKIFVDSPCTTCDVYSYCGGRCLFAHYERLWGQEGFEKMCYITRFLIHELEKHKKYCINFKDKIIYPPFNNTTEIIP